MKDKVRIFEAVRIKEGQREDIEEKVVQEQVLRIFINEREIAALSCTPHDQTYLAVGFLFSEGFLKNKEQIKQIDSAEGKVVVQTSPEYKIPEGLEAGPVLTSGCGKGKTFTDWNEIDPLEDILIDLDLSLSSQEVIDAVSHFERKSELFRETGGVHSAALAEKDGIVVFNEDIGRHNAVDKVLGESFIEGIRLKDKFMVISGRVSSDILSKVWKCGLSIVISRTAPTSLAIKMAQKLGITVVGFARGKRMNVYSFPVRIK